MDDEKWVILPMGRKICHRWRKSDGLPGLKQTDFHQGSLSSILCLSVKVVAATRDDTPSLLKILLT
jgi:hypothetical protein